MTLTTDLRCGVIRRVFRAIRLAPEGIDENADAAARRAQILDLVRRDPVVDRAAADTDHLTRFHDADCLPFHRGVPPKVVSEAAFLGLGVQPKASNHSMNPHA